jgi:AcrR family transcriptional regulator
MPVQNRAIRTFETLLDAAAQVLQNEGEARFTTNRVAEAAGFSIGTLYQYFPDKNAIAEALVRRECVRIDTSLRQAIAKAKPNDLEAVFRSVVVTIIDALGGRPKARRFLIVQVMRLGLGQAAATVLDTVGKSLIEALVASDRYPVRPLSDAAIFVLTRTLTGAVRAAVLEESPLLKTRAFEDELVQLALRFVRP